jgi:hypothetical protein
MKEGTTESIAQVMKNGGKIARVSPLNPVTKGNEGIEMLGIDCTMFHDASYTSSSVHVTESC